MQGSGLTVLVGVKMSYKGVDHSTISEYIAA